MVDEAALKRMNFVFDKTKKEWVKKAKPTEAETGTAPETSTEAAALVPREVTNGELSAMILRRFAVLDNALARMDAKLDAGLARMDAKLEKFGNSSLGNQGAAGSKG